MGLTLPAAARPWLEHSGVEWPDLDEDALDEHRAAWTSFAETGEAQTSVAASAVDTMMSTNVSWGLLAFSVWFQRMSGPTGHMPAATLSCRTVAGAVGLVAAHVIALKVAILASLPALAVVYYADRDDGTFVEGVTDYLASMARAEIELLQELAERTVSAVEGLGTDIAGFIEAVHLAPIVLLMARPIHRGRERISAHREPIAKRLHHAPVWVPAEHGGQRNFPDQGEPNSVMKRYSKADPRELESYAEYDDEGYLIRRVDLIGSAHGDRGIPVPTPHTQFYERHTGPGGTVHVKANKKDVRPATPEEIP